MANDLSVLVPKILARGLLALREQAVMPRLVNPDYDYGAAQKGSTISIPLPQARTIHAVTPSNVLPAAQSSTPTLVNISIDEWNEVDFDITDKQRSEIEENPAYMPGQASEAVRTLANAMDQKIHACYKDVYGYIGTAGSTPFSAVSDVINARTTLNKQLAPMDDRRMVVNPDAEGNMLMLAQFANFEQTGDPNVKIRGQLGQKFGFDMIMSQNVLTHTAGTAGSITVASTTAAGASAVDLIGSVGGTLVIGDVFSIAGNSQTYVVKAAATLSGTKAAVSIDPPLVAIASAAADVSKRASHVVNLAFTKDAFAFVNRPLANFGSNGLGTVMSEMTDPVTGLSMRLEVSRQNKQERFAFDVLYGAKCIRPQFAVRIAG